MELIIRDIIFLAFFALLHWALVPRALQGLFERQRAVGGRMAPWALAIVFLTCFGPLSYLVLHPQTES